MPTLTCFFYIVVTALAVAPLPFVWSIWRDATAPQKGWIWTNQDSRDMYVDGAKTLITASGIAVALLAFVRFGRDGQI
jgi:hypothetical protein